MANQRDINQEVLDYLGVDTKDQNIIGITLRMRGSRFPTLTVHRILPKNMPKRELIERFELRPIEAKNKL